jgi:hypothetical protein
MSNISPLFDVASCRNVIYTKKRHQDRPCSSWGYASNATRLEMIDEIVNVQRISVRDSSILLLVIEHPLYHFFGICCHREELEYNVPKAKVCSSYMAHDVFVEGGNDTTDLLCSIYLSPNDKSFPSK